MPRGRKFELGASAVVALLAGAVVLGLINYMSARHYRRWDWTSSGLYTLSDKSRQVLDEVAGAGEPVTVTALLSPASELYDNVRELLSNYEAACPVLEVEFLDPAREPLRAQALFEKFGIQFETELRYVIFESAGQSKQVDISEFVEYDYGAAVPGAPPRIKAFRGEQAFTGAVLSVTRPDRITITFTTGHGEEATSDEGVGGLSRIAGILESENFRITEWDSLDGSAVPEDTDVLVIAGPRSGFTAGEAERIAEFLEGGGRLLALLDPELTRDGSVAPTGLEETLGRYGIALGADLVVDRRDPTIFVIGAGAETLILRDLPEHPVTRNLGGGAAVALTVARSVTETPAAPAGWTLRPLARTSEEGWAERDLAGLVEGRLAKDPGDLAGPVTVALAAEQASGGEGTEPADANGTESDGAEADGTSEEPAAEEPNRSGGGGRIAVFGDSDFATNGRVMQLGNLDLALNAIHWLAEREALIGIEPRTPEQIVLTLGPGEARNLMLLVLLGLPGAVAVAGLAVWWQRRS